MDIYPQDLGQSRQQGILQRRAVGLLANSATGTSLPAPTGSHLGWLGRQWARGSGLPPQVAATTLSAMRPLGFVGGFTGGSFGFWGPAIGRAASGEAMVASIMAPYGTAMTATGLLTPGIWLRRLAKRVVTPEEMQALRNTARDDLERTYLRLAADVVQQDLTPDAASGMRAALRALGEAIDALPRVSPPRVSPPRAAADLLRAEAVQAIATEAASVSDARHELDAAPAGTTPTTVPLTHTAGAPKRPHLEEPTD